MDIYLSADVLKDVLKDGCESPALTKATGTWRGLTVDTRFLSRKDFGIIKKIVKKPEYWEEIENRRVMKKLEMVEAMDESGPTAKIKKLEALAEAIKRFVGVAEHKWLFKTNRHGVPSPYFVESAKYHPPEKRNDDYRPAHVVVRLLAIARGTNCGETLDFRLGNLSGGKTVVEILGNADAAIETPELVASYEADMKKYRQYAPQLGEQFLATGIGFPASERWNRGKIVFDREGEKAKVVVDDTAEFGEEEAVSATKFWTGKHSEDGDEEGETAYPVPEHPIIRVFNLWTHEFAECHVSCLEPYKYDAKLIDKLVLPEKHKNLIGALTGGAVKNMGDIIKGKAVGVIVMCSGPPGTGKTLTAEVYSEEAERPLYMVQCSQLGTNEEKLEENLSKVLERATRWRAILLIDEADVYIHERGDDIQQNAIVGVFLRLLEYYKGILFMTTNRATIVDDAIVSRVTAHVRYATPEDDESKRKLWAVLGKQYKVEFDIDKAVKEFPEVSGRDIRQLIRLAQIMVDPSKKESFNAVLKRAAEYHDFTELDDK